MTSPTFTFTFEVTTADGTTSFQILSFEGEERISQPFEYRLVLQHTDAQLDFSKVLNQNAELVMVQGLDAPAVPAMAERPAIVANDTMTPPIPERAAVPATRELGAERLNTEVRVQGIVSSFRANRMFTTNNIPYVEYEAVFVPKMWRLGMFHQSRVFQGLTVQQIIEKVFAQYINPACDPVLSTSEYEFKLAGSYQAREFCVQYRESDLDFIQRLMEHEGWYYFYADGKLIISDTKHYEYPLQRPKTVDFAQAAAGTHLADDQIYEFFYDEQVVTKTVQVRDYDYEAFAAAQMETEDRPGSAYGRVGTHYEHGMFSVEKKYLSGFKKSDDPDLSTAVSQAVESRTKQMTRIAKVRAQELDAQSVGGRGKSNVVRLQPGHLFDIVGHYRFLAGADREFLITSVQHEYPVSVETSQTDTSPPMKVMSYRNTFTCLPATIQYRPPRTTPVPRVPGVMTAKVVGEAPPYDPKSAPSYATMTDDEKAEVDKAYMEALKKYNERTPVEGPVDEEGRYRVQIPFDPDPENVAGMSAPSKRVRLAQPHAGTDYGFHFPNRPNTEMVFACVDGDPDRPLGLSMVANPWTHTPVPTTARKLRTQNPWTGSLAGDAITFDEYKNVIRTARGHQIVMDDNNGGQNVGITLQTGSYINTASVSNVDVYWKTRIEMGGYRIKSGIEQVIDGVTEAFGWLKNLILRDLPGSAGMLMGMAASHVESGNYGEDTFGSTTPVGIDMKTDQAINIKGLKGVNITSPNLFGMFSSNFVGDAETQKNNQHAVESIAKGIKKIIWQEVANETVNDFLEVEKRRKSYETETSKPWSPHVLEGFKVRENFYKLRIRAFVNTILNRTGVNVFSAGELKMASLNSATLVAGDEGMLLKSFGSVEQKANTGVDISTHQGITIKATGRPFEGKGAVKVIKGWTDSLKAKAPILLAPLRLVLDLISSTDSFSTKGIKDFGIDIHNESGAIHLHTGGEGGDDSKGAGDIMVNAHGTGNVKLFSNNGQIHAWSGKEGSEGGIVFEVGERKTADKNKRLATDKFGSRINQTDKDANVFAKEKVRISTDDYVRGKSYIEIDKGDQIEIKCGQSSLVMKKDGTITLKGKDISLQGIGDIKVNGKNITSEAKMNYKVAGLNVASDAKAMNQIKGPMAKMEAKGVAIVKGPVTKVGP